MHYAAIEVQIGPEMDFFRLVFTRTDIISVLNLTRNSPDLDEMRTALFFSARRTVLNCKASVTHNAAIEFQIGAVMDFFRFCLARTDII